MNKRFNSDAILKKNYSKGQIKVQRAKTIFDLEFPTGTDTFMLLYKRYVPQ